MNICGKYGTKNRILISIVLLLSLLFPAPLLSSAPATQANKPPQNAVKISPEEYLLEAVRTHQLSLAQKLLAQGADPNFKSFRGMSALVLAAGKGNAEPIPTRLTKINKRRYR